jgi:hypothetical protein
MNYMILVSVWQEHSTGQEYTPDHAIGSVNKNKIAG